MCQVSAQLLKSEKPTETVPADFTFGVFYPARMLLMLAEQMEEDWLKYTAAKKMMTFGASW